MKGGVLPVVSRKGETSHNGSSPAGIAVVTPLATIVQTIFFEPKSFGTVTVKTPHCRRVMK